MVPTVCWVLLCCLYIKFMQRPIKWLMGFDCQINVLRHFRTTPNGWTTLTTGLECLVGEGLGLQRCFFSSLWRGRIIYLGNEVSFFTQSSQNLIINLYNLKFKHPKPTIDVPTKYFVSYVFFLCAGQSLNIGTVLRRAFKDVESFNAFSSPVRHTMPLSHVPFASYPQKASFICHRFYSQGLT